MIVRPRGLGAALARESPTANNTTWHLPDSAALGNYEHCNRLYRVGWRADA